MSNASEPRPPSAKKSSRPKSDTSRPEREPCSSNPDVRAVHAHLSSLCQEDWVGSPAAVQVLMVEMATELDRLDEVIRFLLGVIHGRKSEKPTKRQRQESGEPDPPEDNEPEGAKVQDGGGSGSGPSNTQPSGAALGPDLTPPPPPPPSLGRKKLPSHLPRRQVILDVLGGDKLCSCCGKERPWFISEDDITEKYGLQPAQLFVWQFLRRKYGECPCPKKATPASGPQTPTVASHPAPAPTSPQSSAPESWQGGSKPSSSASELSPESAPYGGSPPDTNSAEQTVTPASENPCLVSAADPVETVPPTGCFPEADRAEEPAAPAPESGPSLVRTSDAPPSEPSASDAAQPTVVPVASGGTPSPASLPGAPVEPVKPPHDTVKSAAAPLVLALPSTPTPSFARPVVLSARPLPQLIRKGLPSHGLLVHIIISKVRYGMPLYRQEAQFLANGVHIKRSTMCGWFIKVGLLLAPIMAALRLEVRSGRCMHIDETPFDVLAELANKATAQCYMWVFAGGQPGRPAVEFQYANTRGSDVPRQYLEGWEGEVLTDGYVGYDFLLKWAEIVLLACWVHVRRKFHDVIKALPPQFRGKNSIAEQALTRIRVLYRLEKYADQNHFTEEQRRQLRLEKAKPIIDEMKAWLEKVRPTIPAKTKLGEAIAYALHLWPRLELYVQQGYRPLDNNWVENLIRPFAVGRKAWLFCATPEGATALAAFHSLVTTAVLNGLDPARYLQALFDQFAVLLETCHPIHGPTPEQCRALLPQYIDRRLLDAVDPDSPFLTAALAGLDQAVA